LGGAANRYSNLNPVDVLLLAWAPGFDPENIGARALARQVHKELYS
jgi:hypothetical protein